VCHVLQTRLCQPSQISDVGLTSSPIIMIMRMSRKKSPSFQFWLVTSQESKNDNGDNENPDQNSVAGTCSDQVFVDHADININFGYTNLMCKVASELGITVDSEKSQEVQYQSVSDHLSCAGVSKFFIIGGTS
jgi:hypothetical protein